MCCTLLVCEELRSVADTKEPCGCGEEWEGVSNKANKKSPVGVGTFQERSRHK